MQTILQEWEISAKIAWIKELKSKEVYQLY